MRASPALFSILIAFLFLTSSCDKSPRAIAYGSDACHFCQMTIVDRRHSAQIVTEKGKSFKYDAIECMMNDLNRRGKATMAYYLAADYNQPGELLDAQKAHFLISKGIPSPMGEYLSAFGDEQSARQKMATVGGTYYTWVQLQEEFRP